MATPLETIRSGRRLINHAAKHVELKRRAQTLHYLPTKITIQ